MTSTTYPDPVSRLLALGEPQGQEWQSYASLGISAQHIPDLMRMVGDDALHYADGASHESWGPLHAWRALAELHATQAVSALLSQLWRIEADDNDWITEEMPIVFTQLGPAIIPRLAAYLDDAKHGLFPRLCAASGLAAIATWHPQARRSCATALARQLGIYARNDPTLNGFLVMYLLISRRARRRRSYSAPTWQTELIQQLSVTGWRCGDNWGCDLSVKSISVCQTDPVTINIRKEFPERPKRKEYAYEQANSQRQKIACFDAAKPAATQCTGP